MKSKLVLLGVAILAIGLMIMPYTITAYVGRSHDWSQDGLVSTDDDVNWTDADCNKCHAGTTGEDTTPGAAAYHGALTCADCHDPQWTTDAFGAPAGSNHTAITIPSCVQSGCHPDVATEFGFVAEPHYELYQEADLGNVDGSDTKDVHSKVGSPNEACIACHTSVNVNVNFVWSEAAGTITIDATGGPTGWTIVDFS